MFRSVSLNSISTAACALALSAFVLIDIAAAQCSSSLLGNKSAISYTNAVDLEITDLNGDDSPDLIYGGTNSNVVVYWNATSTTGGQPSFFTNLGSVLTDTRGSYDLGIGDFITDSAHVDLIVSFVSAPSPQDGKDRVYKWNTTTQFFTYVGLVDPNEASDYCLDSGNNPYPYRKTTGVDLGDVDGDGKMDLVQSYRDSRCRLFLGDGLGGFGTIRIFPLFSSEQSDPYPGNGNRDIHLGDLDMDGDLDCAVVRYGEGGQPPCSRPETKNVVIYKNLGSPINSFLPWQSLSLGASISVEFADINGDGYLDLVQPLMNVLSGTLHTRVYLNNGNGILGSMAAGQPDILVQQSGVIASRTSSVAIADLNGDSLVDLVLTHPLDDGTDLYYDEIWLQKATNPISFCLQETVSPFSGTANDETLYVEIDDVNMDGMPDYLDVNHQSTTQQVIVHVP